MQRHGNQRGEPDGRTENIEPGMHAFMIAPCQKASTQRHRLRVDFVGRCAANSGKTKGREYKTNPPLRILYLRPFVFPERLRRKVDRQPTEPTDAAHREIRVTPVMVPHSSRLRVSSCLRGKAFVCLRATLCALCSLC